MTWIPQQGPRWKGRSRIVRMARLWRTRNPRLFTEKVRYKMLRDHRPLLVTFADKAAVRQYVASQGLGHVMPRAFAALDDPRGVEELDLPDAFVMKPTHGSGAAIVVSATAPIDAQLPRPEWGWVYAHVRPEHADRGALAAIAAGWMGKLYGRGPNEEWAYSRIRPRVLIEEKLSGPNEEWAYSRIRPRVLIEEKLSGPDGDIPDDYKFFVFHGEVHYIQVDSGRFGARTQDFFTPDWSHLPLSGGPPHADPPHPRPDGLDDLLDIARRLGADTDFVRVDLYVLPDRIVFGELTSYPAGGHSPFQPRRFDAEFGSHWTVPRRYR